MTAAIWWLAWLQGAEAFVYDISGIPATKGVTAITDPAACKADLIINSNVLEHVGFPVDLVKQILNAAPEEGLVFLEVPCENSSGLYENRKATRADWGDDALPPLACPIHRPSGYVLHDA